MKFFYSILSLLLLLSLSFTPYAATISTSFEFNNTSGSFTLTNEDASATFMGGEAKTVGITSLYHSGTNAWMVAPGSTGSIDFNPPVQELSVFFRTQSGNSSSALELLDAGGQVLKSFPGTSANWTEINVSVAELGAPVVKAILRNQGNQGYAVLDDLSATTSQASMGQRLDDPIPAPIQKGSIRLRLKQIASGLTAPNWAVPAPGDPEHLFVGDQDGKLWRINLSTNNKEVFLDVSSLLVPLGAFGSGTFDERGFIGFAFHPQFAENGLLYTYTSEPAVESSDFSTIPPGNSPNHRSVVREWRLNPITSGQTQPAIQDKRILLTVDQPQFNHNAGALNFGPDGMLFIAFGDGGGADDRDGQDFGDSPIIGHGPDGNGQNPGNPLGSLLRIDPAGRNSGNGQYGIPSDNPFVGSDTALDEIYAYGFRNPFRFSFDSPTGLLVLADVGQNDIEEVNVIQAGGNYGWGLKEGSFRFEPNGNEPGFVTDGVVSGNFIDPVIQYDHDEGTAVIGGFIYRGGVIPALRETYLFGDVAKTGNGDGRLFYSDGSKILELDLTEQAQPGFWVLGFGQDVDGELYVLGNTTGIPFDTTGAVYKLVPNARLDVAFTVIPGLDIMISALFAEVPAVDVMLSDGTRHTYRARLQLIEGSQPERFELVRAERLADRFRDDNATFNQNTGDLSLPFIDITDDNGNVFTYSARLQLVPNLPTLTFELKQAELVR